MAISEFLVIAFVFRVVCYPRYHDDKFLVTT